MKTIIKLLIPLTLVAMTGCVVAPYGYHRGYYGYSARPHVFVAPPPVVLIRP